MDANGDGMLSWQEFKHGLQENPDICTRLGIELEQVKALYRQIDANQSGLVNVDEFLVGIIKLTRTSKTIDMLSIDYLQLKTIKELFKLDSGYQNDFQLMRHFVDDIDHELKTMTSAMDKVIAQFEATPEEEAQSGEIDTEQQSGQDELRTMLELERRFRFQTRFKNVEGQIEALKPPTSSGSLASGPKINDTVWNELLNEEVMPWLHGRLLELMRRPATSSTVNPVGGVATATNPTTQGGALGRSLLGSALEPKTSETVNWFGTQTPPALTSS